MSLPSSLSTMLHPIVICGPSGVGKGSLIRKLLSHADFGNRFRVAVSHTTRAPRPGETHGKEYYFTKVEDMKRDIADDKFIEYAEVHKNLYGTSVQSVKDISDEGQTCILEIDMKGALAIRRHKGFDACFMFISASRKALLERLKARNTESDEQMQRRLKTAELEFLQFEAYQNNAKDLGQKPLFDSVLENDDFDETYSKFEETMLSWAKETQENDK